MLRILEHHANLVAHVLHFFGLASRIDAINGHNAFRRMDKTVQMLDQRGFTRAGVADNPNEFAFINRNGHAL